MGVVGNCPKSEYERSIRLHDHKNNPEAKKNIKRPQWESNPRPFDPKSNALIHCAMRSNNEINVRQIKIKPFFCIRAINANS